MKKNVLCLAILLLVSWPGTAQADEGFLGWIEGLSGPGPFTGRGINVRLFCVNEAGAVRFLVCRSKNSATRQPAIEELDVRAEWLSSGNHPRFADAPADTRPVKLFWLSPMVMARVGPILKLGGGAGFMVLWGEGFSKLSRVTLTPVSASLTPLTFGLSADEASFSWRQILKLRLDEIYLTKGFTGADFGNSATRYSTRNEWIRSITLSVDLSFLIDR